MSKRFSWCIIFSYLKLLYHLALQNDCLPFFSLIILWCIQYPLSLCFQGWKSLNCTNKYSGLAPDWPTMCLHCACWGVWVCVYLGSQWRCYGEQLCREMWAQPVNSLQTHAVISSATESQHSHFLKAEVTHLFFFCVPLFARGACSPEIGVFLAFLFFICQPFSSGETQLSVSLRWVWLWWQYGVTITVCFSESASL